MVYQSVSHCIRSVCLSECQLISASLPMQQCPRQPSVPCKAGQCKWQFFLVLDRERIYLGHIYVISCINSRRCLVVKQFVDQTELSAILLVEKLCNVWPHVADTLCNVHTTAAKWHSRQWCNVRRTVIRGLWKPWSVYLHIIMHIIRIDLWVMAYW